MTLPTQLTLLRITLAFLIAALLFSPGWLTKAAALGCFLVASFTDWLDGYLARRWRQVSSLGALLDPLADKVLVLMLFFSFALLTLVPWWMAVVIAARELLITTVRLLAARRRVILPAATEGKQKMVSQVVAILVILTVITIRAWPGSESLPAGVHTMMQSVVMGCLWVTVFLTLLSGIGFFWRHRTILKEIVTR